jgi:hypothetical protein
MPFFGWTAYVVFSFALNLLEAVRIIMILLRRGI